MSKKLNEDAMRSELTNSAFFEPPKQEEKLDRPAPAAPSGVDESRPAKLLPSPDAPQPKRNAQAGSTALLPSQLEDLSETGYTSHSYRFTDDELRWLKQFCLDAGSRIGRRVHHNTLVRALLRLANDEWNSNPDDNRLSKLLKSLKE